MSLSQALLLGGLLGAASAAHAAEPACRVVDEDFRPLADCRVDAAGQLQVAARARASLHYDRRGNAALAVAGAGYYYLKRDGRSLPVPTYDNGPDPYEDGRVRARLADGRIGYFDTDFRRALPGSFDYAWPFHQGQAEVCQGCMRGPADSDGHVPVVGGRWYPIDRQGRQVGPDRPAPNGAPDDTLQHAPGQRHR